jgi:hypothetical protein
MKTKILIILIITLGSYPNILAQIENNFFCLSGKEFKIPTISLLNGLTRNFKVEFDVRSFIPKNIRITSIDNADFAQDEYLKITEENLKNITFLKDAHGAEITFNYIVKSGRNISKDYAEVISAKEINLVFRRKVFIIRDPKVSISEDTVIINGFIKIDKPVEYKKTNILIERVFDNGKDSTIIVRNNFPEFKEEILKEAKEYNKNSFLGNSSVAKKYFINFSVELRYPECDDFEYDY